MTAEAELKQLITINHRRLQKLKEKKAYLGVNASVEMEMEIEDIEAEIEELQQELEMMNQKLAELTGHPLNLSVEELLPVGERELKQRYPGLIVIVGVARKEGNIERLSHIPAIEHHLQLTDLPGDPLRVCWLIATAGKSPFGSEDVTKRVQKRYQTSERQFIIKTIPNAFDVQAMHRVVRQIYDDEIYVHDLQPQQVIADFTGGTKLMSAGMLLACQDIYPLQFMQYGKDNDGKPVSVPIAIQFQTDE
jgi:hypothetical protein